MVDVIGGGRYVIDEQGDKRLAYAVVDRDRTWVFLAGRTYVVEGPDAGDRARTRQTDDQHALSAPMPATVIAVNTAAGDAVQEGDVLITLEAMKMELPISAPRAGRVKAVHCREGELVQPGIPLVELE